MQVTPTWNTQTTEHETGLRHSIDCCPGLNQYLQEKQYPTTGTPETSMVTVQSHASQTQLPQSNHVIKATKAPANHTLEMKTYNKMQWLYGNVHRHKQPERSMFRGIHQNGHNCIAIKYGNIWRLQHCLVSRQFMQHPNIKFQPESRKISSTISESKAEEMILVEHLTMTKNTNKINNNTLHSN